MMMRRLLHILTLVLGLGMGYAFPVSANENIGTLIVTCNTEHSPERFDRIRFRLVNAESQQRFFSFSKNTPKIDSRQAVIDNLPVGHYQLHVVIPNRDHFFEDVPVQSVTVHQNAPAHVDITVKHHTPPSSPGLLHTHYPLDIFVPSLHEGLLTSPALQTLDTQHSHFWLTQDAYCSGLIPFGRCFAEVPHTSLKLQEALTVTQGASLHPDIPTAAPIQATTLVAAADPAPQVPMSQDSLVVTLVEPECCQLKETTFEENEALLGSTLNNEEESLDTLLIIEAMMPSGELATIHLEPDSGEEPLTVQAISQDQHVTWQFEGIEAGSYRISFELPESYLPSEIIEIEMTDGETTRLHPTFIEGRLLIVSSNSERAVYTLENLSRKEKWIGRGRRHHFPQLSPGDYTIHYTTSAPQYEQAPPPEHIDITPYQNAYINVEYTRLGQLDLVSSHKNYSITLIPIEGDRQPITYTVPDIHHSLKLPEGEYHVILASRQGIFPKPASTHVTLSSRQPRRLTISYSNP